MRYVLTRHAEARANAAGSHLGFDEPLSERGERQAAALARRLRGRRFDALLHSGSTRTAQTVAAILTEAAAGRVVVDHRLREGEVGDWVGERNTIRMEVAAETGTPVWEVTPPGGESYLDIDERLQDVLADLRSGAFGDDVLIVGHGRNSSLLIRALRGTPWPEYGAHRMHQAGVTEFEILDGEVRFAVEDDVSHLPKGLVSR